MDRKRQKWQDLQVGRHRGRGTMDQAALRSEWGKALNYSNQGQVNHLQFLLRSGTPIFFKGLGATLLIFGQIMTRWKKDALVAERCALIGWLIHVNIDSLKNMTVGGSCRLLLAVKITSNWQRTNNAMALGILYLFPFKIWARIPDAPTEPRI